MNLSCSTAALITPLRLRPSYASDRCLIFKDWNGRKDSTWAFWLLISAGTSLWGKTVPPPRPHQSEREAARTGGLARGLAIYGGSPAHNERGFRHWSNHAAQRVRPRLAEDFFRADCEAGDCG